MIDLAVLGLVAAAKVLTAGLGAIVAYQAYRGYRRNDSRTMGSLAVGVALLTTVPLVVVVGLRLIGFADVAVLFEYPLRMIGLGAVLYALA